MMSRWKSLKSAGVALLLMCGCGPVNIAVEPQNVVEPRPTGPLLEETGTLAENDHQGANGYEDNYEIPVRAGDYIVIDLRSTDFDGILAVVPPGGGEIVNDDFEGSIQHSRVGVNITMDGMLKVQVRTYQQGATGQYNLIASRLPAGAPVENPNGGTAQAALAHLSVGETYEGTIDQSDARRQDGLLFEMLLVNVPAGRPVTLAVNAVDGPAPSLVALDPQGRFSEGTGTITLTSEGAHRVQVLAPQGANSVRYRAAATAAASGSTTAIARGHHQIPGGGGNAQAISVGQQLQGEFAASDAQLQNGEHADEYTFEGTAGAELVLSMESSAVDTYLIVIAPNGEVMENDDAHGTNSELALQLATGGTYRVIATTYRAGEVGAYEIKLRPSHAAATTTPTTTAAAETENGTLAAGDSVIPSRGFGDVYRYTWAAGTQVTLNLTSSEFDTYVIVRSPSGRVIENDDIEPGNTNSTLAYQVSESGPHEVVVTSYAAEMTGAYELSVSGGAGESVGGTPAPTGGGWSAENGELAQGDDQLSSGEFVDWHDMQFAAGQQVQLALTSSAFDTYLLVRGPGEFREDNDDVEPGNTNSGLTLAVPAAGTYRVGVTSYRPGETGAYELRIGSGGGTGGGTGGTTTPSGGTSPTQDLTGALSADDRQLNDKYADLHTVTFTPGSPVSIRVESTEFDTYLIVNTPSGQQLDNDDIVSGNTNSQIDIPSAEAGEYQLIITSYANGETGAYTVHAGSELPLIAGQTNTQTGNVWGVFTGISDYPGSNNDLPECANDAVKLAQTLTEAGVIEPERSVVLTDGQVTNAAVRQALARVGQEAGPNDTFIFFFSGHGNRGNAGSSQDPRELDGADETIILHDGPILDDAMGELFDGINTRLSMLALDSCFSGGFAKDVITRPGRIGFFSSEEDVLSQVAVNFQAGGYLSHFLRTGLAGDANTDPRDTILTAGELQHHLVNQFGQHVRNVNTSRGWQHLVVDRGGVGVDVPIFAYPR